MAIRAGLNQMISGSLVLTKYKGFGVLGADIPTTGGNGGGLLSELVAPNSWEDNELRMTPLTGPASGTISIGEDTSASFINAPAGVSVSTYNVYVDNILTGDLTVTWENGAAAIAPLILSQPQSATRTEGQSVTFSVIATGTGNLTYQWRKNGVNISGAVNSSLVIPATTLSDAGSYTVVVSGDTSPSAISNAAVLTVNAAAVDVPASITGQPTGSTVTAGQAVTLTVVAAGTAPLVYQWRKAGVNISGANSSTLTFSSAQLSDSGSYDVQVTGVVGPTVTSNSVTLTVNEAAVAPSITSQPQSLSLTEGQTGVLSVTATGTAPLSYQWRFNGNNIPGANLATLTLSNAVLANAGTYSVVVTGQASPAAVSTSATVTVSPVVVSGTLTTPPLVNIHGTLWTNRSVVINVYNSVTGQLVLQKTGLTSNASGVVSFTDAALIQGTSYAYEVVLTPGGRGLPTFVA